MLIKSVIPANIVQSHVCDIFRYCTFSCEQHLRLLGVLMNSTQNDIMDIKWQPIVGDICTGTYGE